MGVPGWQQVPTGLSTARLPKLPLGWILKCQWIVHKSYLIETVTFRCVTVARKSQFNSWKSRSLTKSHFQTITPISASTHPSPCESTQPLSNPRRIRWKYGDRTTTLRWSRHLANPRPRCMSLRACNVRSEKCPVDWAQWAMMHQHHNDIMISLHSTAVYQNRKHIVEEPRSVAARLWHAMTSGPLALQYKQLTNGYITFATTKLICDAFPLPLWYVNLSFESEHGILYICLCSWLIFPLKTYSNYMNVYLNL